MLRETMKKVMQGELREGTHKFQLKEFTYVAHQTDPEKDYVRMSFAHAEGVYTKNMFEKDITFMVSHLRRQLNRSTESLEPLSFFNELIETKQVFDIWVKYPIVTGPNGLKRVQNLHFLEPYGNMGSAEAEEMEVPA